MVIFDLDGTLWDARQPVAESWTMYLQNETDHDITLTAEDIGRNMGKTMTEIADDTFGMIPVPERYEVSHGCEVFENEYITEHGAELYDGVEDVLKALKEKGIKLAVVSNCQEGYVKAFLDSMDMWKYFDDYEEWGRSGLSKADNIRLVMERNGEDRGVYVGDIQKDADSSHEAGVPIIWAAYGFGKIADAEGVIESFRELPDALEKLGYM